MHLKPASIERDAVFLLIGIAIGFAVALGLL